MDCFDAVGGDGCGWEGFGGDMLVVVGLVAVGDFRSIDR